LSAKDIRLFLSSRYGIQVTNQDVREGILKGLGDGSSSPVVDLDYYPGAQADEDDVVAEEMLDLMQIVALLIIPTLRKAVESMNGNDNNNENASGENNDNIISRRELVGTPPGMIDYVLKMILHDATGSSTPQRLDINLLKQIFTAYGEVEIAGNEELLQEMVECATPGGIICPPSEKESVTESTTASSSLLLDETTFARALTSDVQQYDIKNEIRQTTYYQDVFGIESVNPFHENHNSFNKLKEDDVEGAIVPEKIDDFSKLPVERVSTAASIDITAGTHRSQILMVFLWATVLISFFSYAFSFSRMSGTRACQHAGIIYVYNLTAPWTSNREAMACEFVASIFIWLIFFFGMSLYGFVLVASASMGNHLGSPLWKPVAGASVVLVYIILVAFLYHPKNVSEVYLSFVSFGLGCITILFHLSHIFAILVSRGKRIMKWIKSHPRFRNMMTSSQVFAEMHIKHACSLKMAAMAQNALEIVRMKEKENVALNTHFGQALDAYAKTGKKYAIVGGFFWIWKRVLTNKVYEEDGIWISTRLIASNMAQFIVSLYVLIAGLTLINHVSVAYDSGSGQQIFFSMVNQTLANSVNETLVQNFSNNVGGIFGQFLATSSNASAFSCTSSAAASSGLCPLLQNSSLNSSEQLAVLGKSGMNTTLLEEQTRSSLQLAIDTTLQSLYPSQKYMVMAPVITGTGMPSRLCVLPRYFAEFLNCHFVHSTQ